MNSSSARLRQRRKLLSNPVVFLRAYGFVLSAALGFLPVAGAWAETGSSSAATNQRSAVTAQASSEQQEFGNLTSETLTGKAWEAFNRSEYRMVEVYAQKCIDLYRAKAVEQAKGLSEFPSQDAAFASWALNDVGTSYFVLGQALLAQGRVKEAQAAFNTIVEQFPYAQAWDPRGWFWEVAEAASNKLSTIGTPYDFGDYTSQTLTSKAWDALSKNDHKGVELYTKKSIELYEDDAKKQQAKLTDFAPKDKAFDVWALNDVATAYFILGDSLLNQKRYQEARAAFERVVNDFAYAQCWDPNGWFWKVAVAARGRINKILALTGA